MAKRQRIRSRITNCPPALEGIIVATFWPVAFIAISWYIMRTSSGFCGHSSCKVASKSCTVFGLYLRFVATNRQQNVFFHVCPCHFAGFPSYNTADMKRHTRTSVRFRDQKVAGSNPVTSTRKCRNPKGFRFFFCLFCIKRRLWRFFHATDVQPWEKGQRHGPLSGGGIGGFRDH